MQINLKPTPSNIIIRMPNWIGDSIMASAIIKDIRTKYPNSKITLLCQGAIHQLFLHNPFVDEVLQFKKPNGWIHRIHHFELIDILQKGQYDLGILLPNSFSSAWWFYRGKVKNRLGYTGHNRSWLLNYHIPFPKNIEHQHLIQTYKCLIEPLGINLSNNKPELFLSEKEIFDAKELLNNEGIDWNAPIIGINPGAAYGSAKCWPPERFTALCQKLLSKHQLSIVFFGDSQTSNLVRDICQSLPKNVINLAGKTTLRQLMALIAQCNAFLTNDSGPMHIASALQVPLVAIFGSTSEVKTGPYHNETVIHKKVECSPCFKRTCPIDFKCMKNIEIEEVYHELLKLIS